MSALFSLLLESGAILGFLSESHILLWQTGQLITVITVPPFVGICVHNIANTKCKILRWDLSHRNMGLYIEFSNRGFLL